MGSVLEEDPLTATSLFWGDIRDTASRTVRVQNRSFSPHTVTHHLCSGALGPGLSVLLLTEPRDLRPRDTCRWWHG